MDAAMALPSSGRRANAELTPEPGEASGTEALEMEASPGPAVPALTGAA